MLYDATQPGILHSTQKNYTSWKVGLGKFPPDPNRGCRVKCTVTTFYRVAFCLLRLRLGRCASLFLRFSLLAESHLPLPLGGTFLKETLLSRLQAPSTSVGVFSFLLFIERVIATAGQDWSNQVKSNSTLCKIA